MIAAVVAVVVLITTGFGTNLMTVDKHGMKLGKLTMLDVGSNRRND
jgi:hypothetical protein